MSFSIPDCVSLVSTFTPQIDCWPVAVLQFEQALVSPGQSCSCCHPNKDNQASVRFIRKGKRQKEGMEQTNGLSHSDGLVRAKLHFAKTGSRAGKEREMRKQKIMHSPFPSGLPVISK